MRIALYIFLILTLAGPLYILFSGKIDFTADYRTANRQSANIAPKPSEHPEAIIQAYSARTFNWRGLFAVHTWFAMKPKNADKYIVMHVVGWRLLQKLPPLFLGYDTPDRIWFDQIPDVMLDIRGEKAEKLIPKMVKTAREYPYAKRYHYWPGPNSNTFTAYIGRQIPELELALPSLAIGQDFLTNAWFFARTPSGTGYQFSFFGLFGIAIGKIEGLEINFLGVIYGVSFSPLTIKLPGFGDITLDKHTQND